MSKPPVSHDVQASSSTMKRVLNSTASTASLSSLNSSNLNVTLPGEHVLLSDGSVESSSSPTSTHSPHIRLQIDDEQESRKKPSLKETKSRWTTIDATNQRLRAWLDVAGGSWSFSRSASTDRPLEPRAAQTPQQPLYDVFLGGSCGNTVWRREIVIPYLKKRAITYYDPQRPVWNENMIHEEQIAKENSRLFLFVLDPGTINATSFIEIAYFAARKAPKLVVVFLGRREWSDKAHPMDLPDRIRTVNLVEAILKRHSVPMLTSITDALNYVDEMIIGEKSWRNALSNPLQRLPYIQVKAKHAIQQTASQLRQTVESVQSSATIWTRRIALVAVLEVVLILAAHLFVFPQIPLWFMIVPMVAFDYLGLAGLVLYLKLKMNRKRAQYKRKLVINPPSLPRTAPSSITAVSSDLSSSSSQSIDVGPIQGEMMSLKTVQPNQPRQSDVSFYNSMDMVDQEVRQHYQVEKPKKLKVDRKERMKKNGCMTSPVGYDVFLSCSSGSELDWITQKAVPQLHKSSLSYTSAIMCDKEMRIPLLHTASHILYYIPSYRTFLSGMIEIAYFIGHSDWQVTVCVPTEAECLVLLNENDYDDETRKAVERRNECYQMAFRYLKDMAHRRECRVFTNVEEAVKHIAAVSQLERRQQQQQSEPTKKRAVLRNLMEKQHLVKEKTQANLLAHRSAVIAAATAAANASPKKKT